MAIENKDRSAFLKQKEFCRKYQILLQAIFEDEELKKWCRDYSVYDPVTEHIGLENILHDFLHEAYDADIVISNYRDIIDGKLEERLVAYPTDQFIESLSVLQAIACIAWHFRRDHFSEGSLISESIANGSLLRYFNLLCEDDEYGI